MLTYISYITFNIHLILGGRLSIFEVKIGVPKKVNIQHDMVFNGFITIFCFHRILMKIQESK